jgi:hypothetical protein
VAALLTAATLGACTSGKGSTPLATDVVQTAGVKVSVTHPTEWQHQLGPQNRHYSEVTGLFANFPLQDPCTRSAHSVECHDDQLGAFPVDGVLGEVGWSSGGPGPTSVDDLLSRGTATTLEGRRASEITDNGQSCAGSGATRSLTDLVDVGATDLVLSVRFCWRGDNPAVAAQIRDVVNRLTVDR